MCGESEEKGFQDEKRAELERKQKLDETLREIVIEGFKKEEITISKN